VQIGKTAPFLQGGDGAGKELRGLWFQTQELIGLQRGQDLLKSRSVRS
jgi:hypothetical protein